MAETTVVVALPNKQRRNGRTIDGTPDLVDDFVAVLPRVFAREYTVFGPDPTEIADRLNWLIAPTATDRDALLAWVDNVNTVGVDHVVLCGMGGSSLYPRTLLPFATDPTRTVTVIDTTHPDALCRIDERIAYDRALFLFASKSGSTAETAALQAFFTDRLATTTTDATNRLGVITDPDSPLARHAAANHWQHILCADPHVGGRFSAHTMFGVAVAALAGIDVAAHLDAAKRAFTALSEPAPTNVAVRLAAHLVAVVQTCGPVATVACVFSEPTDPFALWVEQLLAESLGKNGRGVNVVTLPTTAPVDLTVRIMTDPTIGQPHLHADGDTLTLRIQSGHEGVAMHAAVWMLATALAGRGLGINPFDQPDVASAKQATAVALAARTPLELPTDVHHVLAATPHDAPLVLLAYVDPDSDILTDVTARAVALGHQRGVCVTVGVGPRYLHSTGQLHKGALANACYLVIGPDTVTTLAIPGSTYGFETLITAQAAGDVAALRALGRNVAVVTLAGIDRYLAS